MHKLIHISNKESQVLEADSSFVNRAFLYADALFDTLVYKKNKLIFFEAHYFRLVAGMRQLRMDIPSNFTQEYWEEQILNAINNNELKEARVRTTVFRDTEGLYTPNHNNISILISVAPFKPSYKKDYKLGLYKASLLSTNPIDTIKTTNRIHNVLASIFAKENDYDTCVLLNHKKQISETIHANVFLVFGKTIKTPSLSEGCINGIVRQKVINYLHKFDEFTLIEASLGVFELQQADEVFITNSVIGIQAVSSFKRKEYTHDVSNFLRKKICK